MLQPHRECLLLEVFSFRPSAESPTGSTIAAATVKPSRITGQETHFLGNSWYTQHLWNSGVCFANSSTCEIYC